MISLTNYDFQWARSELVIIYPERWGLKPWPETTDITNKSLDSDTLRTGYTPGARHLQREGLIFPPPINHQWLILKRADKNFGNLVVVMVAVGCRKCKSLYQSYS